MWKFMLILGVIPLAITAGFLTTGTQAGINAGSSASGSSQDTHGSHPGAFLMSSASYFLVHSSAATSRLHTWFTTIIPSPRSTMLLDGCLLLFGAFLRRRPNRPADLVRGE
jgi:hypothetical protein